MRRFVQWIVMGAVSIALPARGDELVRSTDAWSIWANAPHHSSYLSAQHWVDASQIFRKPLSITGLEFDRAFFGLSTTPAASYASYQCGSTCEHAFAPQSVRTRFGIGNAQTQFYAIASYGSSQTRNVSLTAGVDKAWSGGVGLSYAVSNRLKLHFEYERAWIAPAAVSPFSDDRIRVRLNLFDLGGVLGAKEKETPPEPCDPNDFIGPVKAAGCHGR